MKNIAKLILREIDEKDTKFDLKEERERSEKLKQKKEILLKEILEILRMEAKWTKAILTESNQGNERDLEIIELGRID